MLASGINLIREDKTRLLVTKGISITLPLVETVLSEAFARYGKTVCSCKFCVGLCISNICTEHIMLTYKRNNENN